MYFSSMRCQNSCISKKLKLSYEIKLIIAKLKINLKNHYSSVNKINVYWFNIKC